ncbi:MAG: 30S ribosomal protein S18 [Candidatus Portnoybacteria bacterium RIFCSPLOWO2_12_FULL_39_9]|uniref:30S ribosomal protein S18 n=1 Tax=Candidatus Portnoybacteria bacterium RIFCSPHIGHO2_12_FULL_38_9 TaxID=1801997 RepID=A0A1G2FE47_9BACT|nr:MAG: 30S ribosomal protein S18 [Candidatus Portnoybacteria bacterium RBG_13_40_8]OGZ35669.1 MAG: 30S ribosomal protein S18 [Candidatus Portnoybacteria bacterium RIFCSPHIGHO2_02_FULL_39_12]OGZ36323.1 MAG: 30S ribosomal protein S18 [Candidatus Portnoybacteria bacterium RIFCSPHIGHO2_12_FULL_38_9]OGZ38286.1 MAG: 30S ribosomal protein S18 [Candidatus Portnoybacteria bacterium RIFCSPLOWO2_01_FULL_38_39]OGZ40786.1 MAG: 30S ribosomal protein S18 [Candidatus Portnoybacteria bacterium RIFCSPLOWO2_12_F
MTRSCYFCQQKIQELDEQNIELLRRFVSGQAKIISPKRTNTCAKHQRKLAKAIKIARIMGFLPFVR